MSIDFLVYVQSGCEEPVPKRGFYATKRHVEEGERWERRRIVREGGGGEEQAWTDGMMTTKGIAPRRRKACSFYHTDAFEDMNLLIANLLSDLTRYLSISLYAYRYTACLQIYSQAVGISL